MAENVLKLKKQAVSLGMDKDEARSANRKALESFIANAGSTKSSKKGATKKAAKKTAKVAAKKTAKVNSPKAAKTKTAPAKASKPKSKTNTKRTSSNSDGRHMIGSLDFSKTDGWNPRDGSPVALIFKTLKKCKGNVEKATDILMPEVSSLLTSVKGPDGKKLGKELLRNRLKYRVNRTKWEFATRTGQHTQSENRVEYGTGEYATSRKPARKASTTKQTRKPATKGKTTKSKKGKKAGRK